PHTIVLRYAALRGFELYPGVDGNLHCPFGDTLAVHLAGDDNEGAGHGVAASPAIDRRRAASLSLSTIRSDFVRLRSSSMRRARSLVWSKLALSIWRVMWLNMAVVIGLSPQTGDRGIRSERPPRLAWR